MKIKNRAVYDALLEKEAVLKSSAQANISCQELNDFTQLKKQLQHKIYDNCQYSQEFRLLILILSTTGARISEILRLNKDNLKGNGLVYISSLKGSEKRVEKVEFALIKNLNYHSLLYYPFQELSRFYVHRELKKMGIYHKFKGQNNNSVTHLFRNIYAIELNQAFGIDDVINKKLGHKNPLNFNRYANKKK